VEELLDLLRERRPHAGEEADASADELPDLLQHKGLGDLVLDVQDVWNRQLFLRAVASDSIGALQKYAIGIGCTPFRVKDLF
jgi:hypothetical protein